MEKTYLFFENQSHEELQYKIPCKLENSMKLKHGLNQAFQQRFSCKSGA